MSTLAKEFLIVALGVVNRSEAVGVPLRMQFRAGHQLDPVVI